MVRPANVYMKSGKIQRNVMLHAVAEKKGKYAVRRINAVKLKAEMNRVQPCRAEIKVNINAESIFKQFQMHERFVSFV